MIDKKVYEGDRETAWCPGCGNFAIRSSLIDALTQINLSPGEVVMVSGIGQGAKMPHYIRVNGFNGLHGRALPVALGIRIANPNLKLIVESGDGDTYGEGGNHLLHTIRRNPHLAHFVHNNQIYGLTKGQASPTTGEEVKVKYQLEGPKRPPFNPILFGVAMGASFVARGFAGDRVGLTDLMKKAILHRGYALLDILQPCVSFNKVNTYQWYRERIYSLKDHNPQDFQEAINRAREWGEKIPVGIFYQEEKPIFRDTFPFLPDSLVKRDREPKDCLKLLADMR